MAAGLALSREFIAETSLVGMAFDGLGGCYLAYDLLGGKNGPLREIARSVGYITLFFLGYYLVLGPQYALIAGLGMGIILGIEFKQARERKENHQQRPRIGPVLFGFLRGVVLGLAGATAIDLRFGVSFGLLAGLSLALINLSGFAPTIDYEAQARPTISKHRALASVYRAIGVAIAGMLAGLTTPALHNPGRFGLQLGLAAGTVSALVGLFSPVIEWRMENLEERRLGLAGLVLILFGMLLQSAQYWVVVFNVQVV